MFLSCSLHFQFHFNSHNRLDGNILRTQSQEIHERRLTFVSSCLVQSFLSLFEHLPTVSSHLLLSSACSLFCSSTFPVFAQLNMYHCTDIQILHYIFMFKHIYIYICVNCRYRDSSPSSYFCLVCVFSSFMFMVVASLRVHQHPHTHTKTDQ